MKPKYILYRVIFIWLSSTSLSFAAGIGDAANEFWVDGPEVLKLGLDPRYPDVEFDFRARQVFVWHEATFSPALQAPNIVLRVFNASDQPLFNPKKINITDLNSQKYPRVAIRENGSFMVIWQSFEPREVGDTVLRIMIRGQAFDPDGNAVGGERLLSDLNTLKSTNTSASISALANGYIIVWQSGQSLDTDDKTSIQGRLASMNGTPLGNQFQVNTTNSSSPVNFPVVTTLANGDFFAVWTRPEVRGRRFQADGTPIDDDFQVNTQKDGTEQQLDIATNKDGRVMIVWNDNGGDDIDVTEIRGRIFSPTLVPAGDDFQVNSNTIGRQDWPSVADYDENGFFVVWESNFSAGGDNEPNGIEGRVVSDSEEFSGNQFQVNTWTESHQSSPSVGGKDGRISNVWASRINSEFNNDTIQSRGWSICGVFCDSFESDD